MGGEHVLRLHCAPVCVRLCMRMCICGCVGIGICMTVHHCAFPVLALNVSMEIDKQPVVQSYEELVRSYVVSKVCRLHESHYLPSPPTCRVWFCRASSAGQCSWTACMRVSTCYNADINNRTFLCVYVCMHIGVGVGSGASPGACTGDGSVTTSARVG